MKNTLIITLLLIGSFTFANDYQITPCSNPQTTESITGAVGCWIDGEFLQVNDKNNLVKIHRFETRYNTKEIITKESKSTICAVDDNELTRLSIMIDAVGMANMCPTDETIAVLHRQIDRLRMYKDVTTPGNKTQEKIAVSVRVEVPVIVLVKNKVKYITLETPNVIYLPNKLQTTGAKQ